MALNKLYPLEVSAEPRDASQHLQEARAATEGLEVEAVGGSAKSQVPSWVMRGRIPCLDGLRAVSIVLVLAQHSFDTRGFWAPVWLQWMKNWGGTGVDVFFVISGFLITLLLLREWERRGTVSLRAFYARRALRILPAYMCYVLTVAVLAQIGWIVIANHYAWVAAATYTTNLLMGIDRHCYRDYWELGHTWSLSVEEHFYIVWPLILVIAGRRRAAKVLVALLCALTMTRYLWWRFASRYVDIDYFTLTRGDAIAVGCIAAFLAASPSFWARLAPLKRHSSLWAGVAVGMLVLSRLVLARSGKYQLTIQHPFESACIAACLIMLAWDNRGIARRFLNSAQVVALGMLSYSLYLWQQLFLANATVTDRWLRPWPTNLLFAVLAAIASYVLIESPFLRLKDRMSARR